MDARGMILRAPQRQRGGIWTVHANKRAYAYANGCKLGTGLAALYATRYDHLDCLRFIRENGGQWYDPTNEERARSKGYTGP